MQREKRKREAASQEAQESRQALSRVAASFPQVAAALELPAAKRSRALAEEEAAVLVRRAFDPNAMPGLGAQKPERTRALMASIVQRCQDEGLRNFLFKCAAFRAQSNQHKVVLGLMYEFDTTCQSVAQALLQRIGRPSKQRLATEVYNRSCTIRAALLAPGAAPVLFEMPFLVPPLVLMGKTSQFIAAAMQRGIPLSDPAILAALSSAADSLVMDMHADLGSANMPALRHLADVAQSSSAAHFDSTCCELHVCNRVKSGLSDLVDNIGRMYCLGNLFRLGSTTMEVIANMEALCIQEVRRQVGPPPQDATAESQKLFEFIFELGGEHHRRANGTFSQLHQDVTNFLSLVNDRMSDATWTHFCWDSARNAPCCKDEAEPQHRVAEAEVNLFVSAGFAVGSLSRFTNASKCLNKLLAGVVCKRILPRVLQFGGALQELRGHAPGRAEEVGAQMSDLALTTSARKRRVAEWIAAPETKWALACIKTVTPALDSFEYELFGFRGRPTAGTKPAPKVTITTLTNPLISPITRILVEMWGLLTQWVPDSQGPWFVLPLCGVSDFNEERLRRMARRQAPATSLARGGPPNSRLACVCMTAPF